MINYISLLIIYLVLNMLIEPLLAVETNSFTQYDESLNNFFKINLQDVSRATEFKSNGFTNFENAQYDLAISNFTKYLSLNPNDMQVYDAIAASHFLKGDFDDAIITYNIELQNDPTNAIIYLNRGNIYRAKREFDKAIADFDECIHLKLTNDALYKSRASAYLHKKEYDFAINDYKKCLELNPNDANVLVSLADTYVKVGQFEKAINNYHEAMAIDPQNINAYNDYAWFRAVCSAAEMRNGKEAIRMATKACDLSKWQRWEYIDTLATAYAESGNFKVATNYERQAMSLKSITDSSRDTIIQHLLLYESHQAYHETNSTRQP
jgi:tetratricopeptide (TPR) repeat protein